MKFLNLKIKPKTFLILFLILVLGLHILAYLLHISPFRFVDNEILLDYQLEKIQSTEDVKTVIVGDSSVGNGINAELFTELSGTPTLNLALTGSYGIIGSLNMVKQARLHHPDIKNVILVQTLDIWTRPFSREGFFLTENGIDTKETPSEFFTTYKWLDRILYRTDPRQVYRMLRHVFTNQPGVLLGNDYFRKDIELKTYKNGKKSPPKKGFELTEFDEGKIESYKLFNQYCIKEELNCVFMIGPIHENKYKYSDALYFEQIYNITNEFEGILSINKIFAFPNKNMGDSSDHVDISHKKESTERYYNEIEDLLIRD